MSDEMTRAKEIDEAVKAADAKKRQDAEELALAGEKIDTIIRHLDSLGKRMDEWEKSKSKDEEEIEEKGDPKPLGADLQVRKDSAAADAEEIEHYKRKNGATHKIAADSVLADIQTDANRASSAWGKDAPHPWEGEAIVSYRRRAARLHQQHSSQWKDVDLRTLSGQALRNATAQIYSDSVAASSAPESYPNTLLERHIRDPISGQKRIEFYGSPSAWTNQFKGGAMYVKAFKTGARYDRD